jgi:hypothetical protein
MSAMNAAIVNVLDRELPDLRGIERDELAAKIAAAVAVTLLASNRKPRRKGRK